MTSLIRLTKARSYSRVVSGDRRVVVTGLGLVTSLGLGVKHVYQRVLDGHSGILNVDAVLSEKERIQFNKIPCKIGGFIPKGQQTWQLSEENLRKYIKNPVNSMATIYACMAADQIFADNDFDQESRHEIGVAVGRSMMELEHITDVGITIRQNPKKMEPFFLPRVINNMPAAQISIKYGLKGPNHAVSTACATGLHAMGDAFRFIKNSSANIMLCGGTDANLTPLGFAGFTRMKAMSTKYNHEPEKASRPFDQNRDGFVMSEGAGMLLLEEYNHAIHRGANIYAEVLGYGLSGDAYHISSPCYTGVCATKCMKNALSEAGLKRQHVGYINAHATSAPLGDAVEARAIQALLKDHTNSVYVSSTKGSTGHMLGAAGSVEAIFTVLACNTGMLPPTANLDETDIETELRHIRKKTKWNADMPRRIALTKLIWFWWNQCICMHSISLNF